MSEPGDPGYDDMLEHQTGTEVPDDENELTPMEQEIADLGPGPGAGASARQADAYNFAVQEVEKKYAIEAQEKALHPDEVDDDESSPPEPVYIDAHTNEVVTGEKP